MPVFKRLQSLTVVSDVCLSISSDLETIYDAFKAICYAFEDIWDPSETICEAICDAATV